MRVITILQQRAITAVVFIPVAQMLVPAIIILWQVAMMDLVTTLTQVVTTITQKLFLILGSIGVISAVAMVVFALEQPICMGM